jgi:hypothetical protein
MAPGVVPFVGHVIRRQLSAFVGEACDHDSYANV